MKSTSEIASRFREIILNGTWVANTNYKLQLENLDWKTAIKPIENLNTIAVLAQHIDYYINGLNQVFKGGTLDIKDKFSFDFPPFQSQEEWDNFLDKFWNDSEEFASLIEQMPDEKLNEPFVDEKYGTYRRNIDCMIEHSYYHLGQIVLIRKLLN
ncbi:DinB family protein [Flavobacterium ginsengiterrae]|uniref:Damage-inducible protein DinB n=1 Tax=Flavobacterium ginsengiterrae TaxID=871695 RepID=A0ABP7GPF9_9FLAO